MPYIEKKERTQLDEWLNSMPIIGEKGSLEYVIFRIMRMWMDEREERYANIHDCVYAVQHCADEFKRRVLDIYEDLARKENGDVEAVCQP